MKIDSKMEPGITKIDEQIDANKKNRKKELKRDPGATLIYPTNFVEDILKTHKTSLRKTTFMSVTYWPGTFERNP